LYDVSLHDGGEEERRGGEGREGRFTFLKIGFWASLTRSVHLRERKRDIVIQIACDYSAMK